MRERQIFEGTLNILLNNSKQISLMPEKDKTKLFDLLATIVLHFDKVPQYSQLRNKVSLLSAKDKQQKRKSYSTKNNTRLSHKQQKNPS